MRLSHAVALATLCTGTACTPPQATPAAAPAPTSPPPPVAQATKPPGPMPAFVPPSKNPAAVKSGTYAIEPEHTQILFSVLHLGLTTFYGQFSGASGTLTVNAKDPGADTIDVTVPMASVHTNNEKLNGELTSPMFFDAATYPTMTFKSTKVTQTGKTTARVTGTLTLHGVSKPITLTASFMAGGTMAMINKTGLGFSITGTLKRSDFGITAGIPFVGDETRIIISAAFIQ